MRLSAASAICGSGEIAGASTCFALQPDVCDLYAFVQGFAHIVNRQSRNRYRRQRFHLHACFAIGCDGGEERHAVVFNFGLDVGVCYRQRMTKRDERRSLFGRIIPANRAVSSGSPLGVRCSRIAAIV